MNTEKQCENCKYFRLAPVLRETFSGKLIRTQDINFCKVFQNSISNHYAEDCTFYINKND